LSIRVTDRENTEIVNAASQLGLTPTGFCAHAALDAARHLQTGTTERIEREALANLQAELFQARVALNQLRTELGRTGRGERASPDGFDPTIARAANTLANLDAVVSRVHRRLTGPNGERNRRATSTQEVPRRPR
jgi:hypothetical protein